MPLWCDVVVPGGIMTININVNIITIYIKKKRKEIYVDVHVCDVSSFLILKDNDI